MDKKEKSAQPGAQPPETAPPTEMERMRAEFCRLDRRDWWLWAVASGLTLLLTTALTSFSLPGLFKQGDTFWQFHQDMAGRGLLGLVLVFVVYTGYQRYLIRQFRRRLAEQVVETVRLDQQRRRAEELLRLSEDKFSKAFHSSPDAMTISSFAEQRYLEVNEAFLEMVGYDKCEVVGRTATKLCMWVNPAHYENLLAALEKKQKLEGAEFLFRTKVGDIRYGELSAQVIEVAGEKCLLSAIRDCTEQRKAEEALRNSEARSHTSEVELRSLVENAPYGIYRSSLDTGRFVSVNPALVQMLGYGSAQEVLALDLGRDVFRRPEDRARMAGSLRAQGRFRNEEFQWKRKDGSRLTVCASGRVVHDSDDKAFFEIMVEDVSTRAVLEV